MPKALVRASRVTGARETGLRPRRGMFRAPRWRVSPAATLIRSAGELRSAVTACRRAALSCGCERHSRPGDAAPAGQQHPPPRAKPGCWPPG